MKKHLYTYTPDLPDFRDFAYAEHGPVCATPPRRVDLSAPLLSPIYGGGGGTSATQGAIKGGSGGNGSAAGAGTAGAAPAGGAQGSNGSAGRMATFGTMSAYGGGGGGTLVTQGATGGGAVAAVASLLSPVKDQGQLGSCTANAGAAIAEFSQRQRGLPGAPLSRLMYYWLERSYEHTTQSDSGAQIRDGIKALASVGVCSEDLLPYIPAHYKRKPAPACYAQAAANKISKYARLGEFGGASSAVQLKTDIINCLASGMPFTFGFSVFESFESAAVAKSGLVPMPQKSEKLLGGHAVYAIGYDLDNGLVRVRNSWGTGWGIGGDFLIPMEYLLNSNLAEDFWAILPG